MVEKTLDNIRDINKVLEPVYGGYTVYLVGDDHHSQDNQEWLYFENVRDLAVFLATLIREE